MPNQFLSPDGDLENYFITEYWLIDQYVGDTLWSWGLNTSGQLGNNTTINRSTPVTTLTGGANWQQVSGGLFANVSAIKTDGTLWTWGANGAGHLGINLSGAATGRTTPVTTFAGGTDWKFVSSGTSYTAAIKTNGTLWAWGLNTSGHLGDNTTTNRSTPVTTFTGGTNWKRVSCGQFHTAAIKTDGTLWTWGGNGYGQLGINLSGPANGRVNPVTTFAGGTNWSQVECGVFHTAGIKTDGTLWVWGRNSNVQLGINDTTSRLTPVTTFVGGTNWKQISGGTLHTAAIKTDGTLWIWGNNAYGQIGNNTTTNRSTPVTTFSGGTNWKQVSCGEVHTAAIKTDGTLWTWGRNYVGQLGINLSGAATGRTTPVTTFAGGTNWKQVSCGDNTTLAVTSGTDPTFFIT